jgi:hypothetical protein
MAGAGLDVRARSDKLTRANIDAIFASDPRPQVEPHS